MLKLIVAQPDSSTHKVPNFDHSIAQVWRDKQGNASAYSCSSEGQYWVDFPSVSRFYLQSHQEEVKAIPYPRVRLELVQETFRRFVLPMMIQALGTEVLHASAILTRTGVVAICGHSGEGKSTTAFGLSQRNYPLWADDTVAFERSGSVLKSIPLPFKMSLEPDAAEYFNEERTESFHDSKLDSFGEINGEPQPLVTILVLQRASDLSDGMVVEAIRLLTTHALPVVLPYAHYFGLLEEKRRQMVLNYLELIAKVPVFKIRFQAGLAKLPLVLDCIEQTICYF